MNKKLVIYTLVSVIIIIGVASCNKHDDTVSCMKSIPSEMIDKSAEQERGIIIPLDMERKWNHTRQRYECTKVDRLHICFDWITANFSPLYEIQNCKAAYMVPSNYRDSCNQLDLIFDYSLISKDERLSVNSELIETDSLDIQHFSINHGDFNINHKGNLCIFAGKYPIKSWDSTTCQFIVTVEVADEE